MNNLFLELIQVSIGHRNELSAMPTGKQWALLFERAKTHALIGLCFDGIQKLGATALGTIDSDSAEEVRIHQVLGMDKKQYLRWMSMTLKVQAAYDRHEFYIMKLAEFYEKEGIGMMLLKGYGLSRFYPHPRLRTPGDVDVFLFDLDEGHDSALPVWKRGDEAIRRRLKVEVRNDCEHHTKFRLDEIMVENHYDFINTRIRRSSGKLEKDFKTIAQDHTNFIEITGQRIYLPSDRLNALFLLRHAAGHFASEGITLRNVLDWAFFVQSAQQLDWNWLWGKAREYNMHRFLACLNAICIEDLGFATSVFVQKDYDSQLKERVLQEIIKNNDEVCPTSMWGRTYRWWCHRWKHRICYSDSLFSSFVYSIRANVGGTSAEYSS